MVNKKGAEKFNIIISLILGLMILTISLFWIFGEFFNQDELDWQVCRQSIILRASLPEADLAALKLDTKGAFPLKCRTEVVTIDSAETPDEVYGKISEAVAEGWYMFGEGEMDFVSMDSVSKQSVCMVFARVHYTSDALNDLRESNYWYDEFKKEYGDRLDLFPRDVRMQLGFENYYGSTKMRGSKMVYGDYLPIYEDDFSDSGNLFFHWGSVDFSGDDDYLLVYKINKASGMTSGTLGSFLLEFVPEATPDYLWTDKRLRSWEEQKIIFLVSTDALEKVGCDKFLTIPA